MKNLVDYIEEGLLSRKVSIKTPIKYSPETKVELKEIIVNLLKKGITDLNCIDVSKITDMSCLFYDVNDAINVKDIDVSKWDVSNVTNMGGMFAKCTNFNSDISKWDVSEVTDMGDMFYDCKSFNQDISEWNVSSVLCMNYMFDGCNKLIQNKKIPDWYKGKL